MSRSLLKKLTEKEFGAFFDSYKKEAFRLETLPQYRIDEEKELVAYFKKNKYPRPLRPQDMKWLEEIRQATQRGAIEWRIRRVSRPMTFYEKLEMATFKQQGPYGRRVWVFTRDFGDMPELESLPYAYEYWMFDEKKVVLMNYDMTGRCEGASLYLGDSKPYIALRNKLKKISKRVV